MKIQKKIIDIFDSGYDMIVQQTNCRGVMGAGLALQIKRKYPEVYDQYLLDFRQGRLKLGYVGIYKTKDNKYIACMCAQDYYGRDQRQTDYEAFEFCYRKVLQLANSMNIRRISIPGYIGCGLAGGNWSIVSNIMSRCHISEDTKNIKSITICYRE